MNIDLTAASTKLQKVLNSTLNSIDEHQIDRITIYSVCGLRLIVSFSGILLVIRTFLARKSHGTTDNRFL